MPILTFPHAFLTPTRYPHASVKQFSAHLYPMPETFSLTTSSSTTTYASYLLRLRWHRQEDEWVCQILLTSVTTGEQRYFTSPESLFAYLHGQQAAAKGGTPSPFTNV